jgi:LemA protein
MSIVPWIVLGIVVVVVLWAIVSYNRLVAMRQQCNQSEIGRST